MDPGEETEFPTGGIVSVAPPPVALALQRGKPWSGSSAPAGVVLGPSAQRGPGRAPGHGAKPLKLKAFQ